MSEDERALLDTILKVLVVLTCNEDVRQSTSGTLPSDKARSSIPESPTFGIGRRYCCCLLSHLSHTLLYRTFRQDPENLPLSLTLASL